MIKGLIGKKLGMITTYLEDGEAVPVTVVEAGPCPVLQVKTKDKEGYEAVQLGFGQILRKRVRRDLAGRVKNMKDAEGNAMKPVRMTQEFDLLQPGKFPEVGQVFNVHLFDGVKKVKVAGRSKGKGFQGCIKRHHFKGGGASHGSCFHRAPGSVGCNAWPAETKPGRRMSGHMGSARITVRNVKVERIDENRNLLFLRGALPGPAGGTVYIYRME